MISDHSWIHFNNEKIVRSVYTGDDVEEGYLEKGVESNIEKELRLKYLTENLLEEDEYYPEEIESIIVAENWTTKLIIDSNQNGMLGKYNISKFC